MSELRELYQGLILDHNKSPRNFEEMSCPDRTAEGNNPLCGDHYTVYLKLNNDVIENVTFKGSGCAISKASASMMTTVLKGKTIQEFQKIFDGFHDMVTGVTPNGDATENLGKLAVFEGVREFPIRVKCASLAWHTIKAAIEGREESVSTE